MNNKIDEFANKFEEQIKKGFITALILLVLDNKECHGYQIIKEIHKETHGVWQPAASTVYPILKTLKKNGFIRFKEEKEKKGRTRKIYEITTEGKKALKKMVIKQENMISEIRSIITSLFGHDGNYPLEELKVLMPKDPVFGWENGKSKEEKIENLVYQKERIEEIINYYNDIYQFIANELERLSNLEILKK